MDKIAQFAGLWPWMHRSIESPSPDVMQYIEEFPHLKKMKENISRFPMSKFNIAPQAPEGEPQAVGYVTTEDADDDGKIDTINLTSPRIEQEFQKHHIPLGQAMSLKGREAASLLDSLSYVMLHEIGHFGGKTHVMHDPEKPEQTFTSEQQADQFAYAATNIPNSFDNLGSLKMEKTILNELKALADHLDGLGHFKLAERAENILSDFAELPTKTAAKSRLYRDMSLSSGEMPLTSKVDFDWGRYEGKHAGEPYWIMDGVSELGSVQFPGDPFTYNDAGEGKILVVSGPEPGRSMIGRLTDDPRAPKAAPAAEAPASPGPVAKVQMPDVLRLAKEIGLKAIPTTDKMGRVDFAASDKALSDSASELHRSKLASAKAAAADAAERVELKITDPTGSATPHLDTLKDPTATSEDIFRAFRALRIFMKDPQYVSQADFSKFEREMYVVLEDLAVARKAEMLIEMIGIPTHDVGGQRLGPGRQGFSMEAKEDEENITKKAFELPEPPAQGELETLFWSGRSVGPFGRD